jgi:FkbM family methyltransferase
MFDVGANSGANSLPLAAEFPNARIYAFEPTPELSDRVRYQAPLNYTVIQKAVGAISGRKVFIITFVSTCLTWRLR